MRSKFMPFSDLVQVSPDGEFVFLDYSAIHLPNGELSNLIKLIGHAFDHYQEMHELYPLRRDKKRVLSLA